jgi:signal transduction histidine kinase
MAGTMGLRSGGPKVSSQRGPLGKYASPHDYINRDTSIRIVRAQVLIASQDYCWADESRRGWLYKKCARMFAVKSHSNVRDIVPRWRLSFFNIRWIATSCKNVWAHLSLSLRFSLAATIVVGLGMFVMGKWVTSRIEVGVIGNASLVAASYFDNVIAPNLQELATGSKISEENQRAIDRLLTFDSKKRSILTYRIWQDNTIVHGTRRDEIGKSFPVTDSMRRALTGMTVGELEFVSDEHSPQVAAAKLPVLEIYAPVYQLGTNRIIAVAETYEINTQLLRDLANAQFESWVVVGLVTLVIIGALFGIVQNGSRTIERQSVDLERRVVELTNLLDENENLRRRVRQANERVADSHERLLRSVGADLHDGPVQLLGLATLKLEDFCDLVEEHDKGLLTKTDAPETMRSVLAETLQEIRNLSSGLAPPDIENLPLSDALVTAIKKHERRTGTRVEYKIGKLDLDMSFSIKTCMYRFVQEGLNNAYRHAGGMGQTVTAQRYGDAIEVEVRDSGRGIGLPLPAGERGGHGLSAMRDRIESLGGYFEILSNQNGGTRLFVRFEFSKKVKEMVS